MSVTLNDLRIHGVIPQAHEAVAVVLALFAQATTPAEDHQHDDSAAPTPSTITVDTNGVVYCHHAIADLSPSEIATLLQQVMEDAPRVPPGLLYAIARAQRAVQAPPFESP